MEAYQVVAGFSDIKSELLFKTRTQKTMEELVLWFSVEDGVLYVHDFEEHETCIVLAIKEKASVDWKVFLRPNSYGAMLISKRTKMFVVTKLAEELNAEYNLCGFF